ncbi:MAG TPA: hypothetical protein VN541_01660, partial [Tepidisphaeraceae bacterium]|nr:hypothetical protein [Tepidisphaeraceae bacterium]
LTPASSSSSSSTSTTESDADIDGRTISVDSNGNPVGDQTLPFSVLPAAIQNGLNNNKPSGATALASDSTQDVQVLTANGVTFYSTTFIASGTSTTVTVNSSGAATSLPSVTTAQFSTIPTAAQTELKTLATAEGIATAIADAQGVTVYNEGNGTTIYSVTLSGTSSTSGKAITITISSDQNGNPTVPPRNGRGGGCGGGGAFGDFGGGFGRRGNGD